MAFVCFIVSVPVVACSRERENKKKAKANTTFAGQTICQKSSFPTLVSSASLARIRDKRVGKIDYFRSVQSVPALSPSTSSVRINRTVPRLRSFSFPPQGKWGVGHKNNSDRPAQGQGAGPALGLTAWRWLGPLSRLVLSNFLRISSSSRLLCVLHQSQCQVMLIMNIYC